MDIAIFKSIKLKINQYTIMILTLRILKWGAYNYKIYPPQINR